MQGYTIDSQPYVMPTAYGRVGEKLYFHGGIANRTMKTLKVSALRVPKSAQARTYSKKMTACIAPTSPQSKYKVQPRLCEQLVHMRQENSYEAQVQQEQQ